MLTRLKQKARYPVSAEFDDQLMIWIRRAGKGRHPGPPGPVGGGHCTRLGIRCSLCTMSRPYRSRALVIILLIYRNQNAQITLKRGRVFKQRQMLNLYPETRISWRQCKDSDSADILSICLMYRYSQTLQRLQVQFLLIQKY